MRFRYLLYSFILITAVSCASVSTEPEDLFREESSPMIIIVEEPVAEEPDVVMQEQPAEETAPSEEIPEEDTKIAEDATEIPEAAVPAVSGNLSPEQKQAEEPLPAKETIDAEEETVEFGIISAEAREQSAVFVISYPEDIDFQRLSTIGGGRISEIRLSGDTAEITVTGLDSITDYSISFAYDDVHVTDPYDIHTSSFAGTYSWSPANGEDAPPFVLSVKEAPETSAFNYYIYLHPMDSEFPEGFGEWDIRIAPLVDEGENAMEDLDYDDAPEGYLWNNRKWNTGSIKPSRITYIRSVEPETPDEIHMTTASVALGFTAESDNRFIFHEKDGKAYLIYNNIMSPSIANNFIKRNPSPGIREYEADGSWYTLERIQ